MNLKHENYPVQIMVSTVKRPKGFGWKTSRYETCIFDLANNTSDVVRVYGDEHSAAEGHKFFCNRYSAHRPRYNLPEA